MSQRGIVFPGQGAQHPGMGAAILDASPAARQVMDRANEALGFDLAAICRKGPADRLAATDICQPAIFATSAAVMEALRAERGLKTEDFSRTAGLSLGEYTALWFAGSLSLEDALHLVHRRGKAMQQASEEHPSGMISLLGASREQAVALAEQASDAGVLVAANFLAPGQVAISGAMAALDRAEVVAKEMGIRRAIRLKVAGAFHSPLMASATDALRGALLEVEIGPPAIPFFANVTGEEVSDPEEIRGYLADQVTSPVLWEDTIAAFLGAGVSTFVEPAPGKVLTSLLRKMDRGATGVSIESLEDLRAYGTEA